MTSCNNMIKLKHLTYCSAYDNGARVETINGIWTMQRVILSMLINMKILSVESNNTLVSSQGIQDP
jgi:hypothetical protein